MFKLLPPNVQAVNIHISSLAHRLRLLLALTFVALPYLVGVLICILNGDKFIYGKFEDCNGLSISIVPLIAESLLGNAPVNGNYPKASGCLFIFLY